MFKSKFVFFVAIIFLITSCSDTWDSVKRGLTGAKQKSTDEFLVEKKDPLILPPDFEDLPTPGERETAREEILSFQKKLTEAVSEDSTSTSSSTSTEQSILKQIRNK